MGYAAAGSGLCTHIAVGVDVVQLRLAMEQSDGGQGQLRGGSGLAGHRWVADRDDVTAALRKVRLRCGEHPAGVLLTARLVAPVRHPLNGHDGDRSDDPEDHDHDQQLDEAEATVDTVEGRR